MGETFVKLSPEYKPVKFFIVTFIATWIPWFVAALLSYQSEVSVLELPLIFVGMFAPFIVALSMIYSSKDKTLRVDFWERLCPTKVNVKFLPVILLIMPLTLFVATTISVLLGDSTDQFSLSNNFRVIQGQSMIGIVILFLAPLMEELGWRGYGVDSLRSRFNLARTTLLFAGLWALWHLPLFFIKGYYQNSLLHMHPVFVLNFFVSVLPAAFLINWVYYKNDRSILAAFCMHLMLNLSAVLFQTTQVTKCILTLVLMACALLIFKRDREFFSTLN